MKKRLVSSLVLLAMALTSCSLTDLGSSSSEGTSSAINRSAPASPESEMENSSETKETTTTTESPKDESSLTETTAETTPTTTTSQTTTTTSQTTTTTTTTKATTTTTTTKATTTTTAYEYQYQKISSFEAYALRDYVHADTDTMYLGTNEGATITITCKPSSITSDDIFFYADETILDYWLEDESIDTKNNSVAIKVGIKGLKPGNATVYIASNREMEEKGDSASVYTIDFCQLDATQGRTVYVTPTGEKYHLSKACAGENAMATTLYDVKMYEYSKCGKCG